MESRGISVVMTVFLSKVHGRRHLPTKSASAHNITTLFLKSSHFYKEILTAKPSLSLPVAIVRAQGTVETQESLRGHPGLARAETLLKEAGANFVQNRWRTFIGFLYKVASLSQ